jgi:hypothetical protein
MSRSADSTLNLWLYRGKTIIATNKYGCPSPIYRNVRFILVPANVIVVTIPSKYFQHQRCVRRCTFYIDNGRLCLKQSVAIKSIRNEAGHRHRVKCVRSNRSFMRVRGGAIVRYHSGTEYTRSLRKTEVCHNSKARELEETAICACIRDRVLE